MDPSTLPFDVGDYFPLGAGRHYFSDARSFSTALLSMASSFFSVSGNSSPHFRVI